MKITIFLILIVFCTGKTLIAQSLRDKIQFSYSEGPDIFKEESVHLQNNSATTVRVLVECTKSDPLGHTSLTTQTHVLGAGEKKLIGYSSEFGSIEYSYTISDVQSEGNNQAILIVGQKTPEEIKIEQDKADAEIALARQRQALELAEAEAKRKAEIEQREKQEQLRISEENRISGGANSRMKNGVVSDNLEMVKKAIAEKAVDVNAIFENSQNILFLVEKNPAIVELLIEKGADVKAKDYQGNTPLHFVKTIPIAEVLLKYGANINIPNEEGITPLNKALRERRIEIAKTLVLKGADIKSDPSLLVIACNSKTPDLDLVRMLLDKGADPNADSNEDLPLGEAIISGNMDLIQLLISKGASPKRVKQYYYGYPTSNKELKKFLRDSE
ncbi:MAG: ankyrin repeat domain-containing protein [Microscillaceae bacterium]|nr:ankyrin repeat domain-containing protein [Microscillaceae bacterium]